MQSAWQWLSLLCSVSCTSNSEVHFDQWSFPKSYCSWWTKLVGGRVSVVSVIMPPFRHMYSKCGEWMPESRYLGSTKNRISVRLQSVKVLAYVIDDNIYAGVTATAVVRLCSPSPGSTGCQTTSGTFGTGIGCVCQTDLCNDGPTLNVRPGLRQLLTSILFMAVAVFASKW